jgi:hypothetical protein
MEHRVLMAMIEVEAGFRSQPLVDITPDFKGVMADAIIGRRGLDAMPVDRVRARMASRAAMDNLSLDHAN